MDNVTCDSILSENDFADILDDIHNFYGLSFPLAVSQIRKFERLNRGTSINVFECGTNIDITPLRVVDELEVHTDLLLYRDGTGNAHYVYIIDFPKLIRT